MSSPDYESRPNSVENPQYNDGVVLPVGLYDTKYENLPNLNQERRPASIQDLLGGENLNQKRPQTNSIDINIYSEQHRHRR